MSSKFVEIDMSEFREFFGSVEKAAQGDFRKEFEKFLDGLGNEFLRIVQDEIVRREVLDSRLLLASFEKGSEGNVWSIEEGGMVLEVGTNVEYAGYVNDGHWTNTKGVARRWVPGYWQGDRFIYDPNAETGMLLKQHWVEGKHYFDSALRILDRIFPDILEAKLQEWLDSYFSG
nr:MAG: virion morphogenesis family protein [Bacteriophage sp.]